MRKRVLFVAESVTLAHVARPLVLARSLDPEHYEVHFACDPAAAFALADAPFVRWPIGSLSGERFRRNLEAGAPLYDEATLAGYVAEEVRLLRTVRPDLVVGDLRLSLSVSAALSQVPYANVVNAHWSPYATRKRFPMPDLPVARWLGTRLGSAVFQLARPAVFALHTRPLNAVRRAHGLPPLRGLLEQYTTADYTLYPDVPGLVPTEGLPPGHHYLGPVPWSPPVKPPAWWNDVPTDRSCVYVTMGSSGQLDALPKVIDALLQLPVTVLLATAGRLSLLDHRGRVWVADYLPGTEAARRSDLVICNGGSATVYQALAQGVPVLGLASNMDQYLTMSNVRDVGGGLLLRASRATVTGIRRAVEELLRVSTYRTGARRVSGEFAKFKAAERFPALARMALNPPSKPRANESDRDPALARLAPSR